MNGIVAHLLAFCWWDVLVDSPELVGVEDLLDSLGELLEGEVVELCRCHDDEQTIELKSELKWLRVIGWLVSWLVGVACGRKKAGRGGRAIYA